jgi:uncharacterized membrane protein
MPSFPLDDLCALAVFVAVWLFYHPLLTFIGRGRGMNRDMGAIRRAWMEAMVRRDNRFMDANLIGHVLSSASFFASTNLLVIAAVIGALFGGEQTWKAITGFSLLARSTPLLFDIKLVVIVFALVRGLLDFIWAIRQLNYFLAIVGAAPDTPGPAKAAYGEAAASVLDPALSAFSTGVRGYYFALAAAAWLIGPYASIAATIGATWLLIHRQLASPAARGIASIRDLLEKR